MRLGGRIMSDFTFTSTDNDVSQPIETATGDSAAVDSGAEFRRARLFASGLMYDSVGFKFQYDFAGGSFKDMYLHFPGIVPEGNLTVGHFKEPFSMEELTSSKYITFTERALPNAFSPGRKTGMSLTGNMANDNLSYGLSLTRAQTDDPFGSSQGEGGYAATGRITGTPYADDDDSQLLHLGGSISTRSVEGTGFSSRPETHLVEEHVSVQMNDAQNTLLYNFETAFVYESFSVQGEYIRADVDSSNFNDPSFGGYYLQASYWLTGEQRNYSRGSGSFSRVRPDENFANGEGGTGAWEIAGRASNLDLNDGPAQGGELDTYTLGINWHLNPHVRVMGNYVRGDVSQGTGGADGSGDYVTFRFQVDF